MFHSVLLLLWQVVFSSFLVIWWSECHNATVIDSVGFRFSVTISLNVLVHDRMKVTVIISSDLRSPSLLRFEFISSPSVSSLRKTCNRTSRSECKEIALHIRDHAKRQKNKRKMRIKGKKQRIHMWVVTIVSNHNCCFISLKQAALPTIIAHPQKWKIKGIFGSAWGVVWDCGYTL